MIVKFHPRGRGGGAGPVDYLLGKDRQRELERLRHAVLEKGTDDDR
ncbi:hypothetical protein STW0522ENT62_P30020 (plasmid) [Enterobacter kobei]|nr:hypothetical protein [Enterobacter kobei]BBV89530.1 hypothetical protein STW0522ENT62_P30020 [Enterobacter kobei]